MNYSNPETVPHNWKVGDVILDLYEVRPVTEGFGAASTQRSYHEGGFGRVYKVWHLGWNREMAVKVAREDVFKSPAQKDAFTRECETWVDLGLHMHIAACHYVRNLGGVPRVFSEYASAGTLQGWIDSGRLYEGTEQEVLARILDISIQFAWGLHYAHERGFIHQDVKPLNALMWDDMTLKVSDFGLAGARSKAGITTADDSKQSILVSSGAMTPPYCSPEQAAGEKLDRGTDIWSWAVSVLQIFEGEVTWRSGAAAGHALQLYLENGGKSHGIPAMPTSVVQLLQTCFNRDVNQRPISLFECSLIVSNSFIQNIGIEYTRATPEIIIDNGKTLNNKALSLFDMGKAPQAEAALNRAHQIEQSPYIIYNHNLSLWKSGQITDKHLLSVIRNIQCDSSMQSTIACMQGLICIETSDIKSAIEHLEQSLQIAKTTLAEEALKLAYRQEKKLAGTIKFIRLLEPATAIAFSPDGKHIAVGSGDVNAGSSEIVISLFDVSGETNQLIRSFHGHSSNINVIAFSPQCDFLLSGSGTKHETAPEDNSLRLWSISSGKCVREYIGHKGPVAAAAFSPNGLRIVSGKGAWYRHPDKNALIVWNAKTCERVHDLVDSSAPITAVSYTMDGAHIISYCQDSTCSIWDAITGKRISAFHNPLQTIHKCNEIEIYKKDYEQLGLNVLYADICRSIQKISNDKRYAVTSPPMAGDTIELWNCHTGQCIRSFSFSKCIIKQRAFSPNSDRLACAFGILSSDKTSRTYGVAVIDISIISEQTFKAPWFYCEPDEAKHVLESDLEFTSNLNCALSAKAQKKLSLALCFIQKARRVPGYSMSPRALALAADIGKDCSIVGYAAHWINGYMKGHTGSIQSLCISRDSKVLLTGSRDKSMRSWDLEKRICLGCIALEHGCTTALEICLDNRSAIVALEYDESISHNVQHLNLVSGDIIRTFKGHEDRVVSLAMSHDGHFFISGSYDGTIRQWEIDTGKCLFVHTVNVDGDKQTIHSLCLSRDSTFFLAAEGFKNYILRLWDFSTGRALAEYVGHESVITCVCFSNDGTMALSSSWDETIRLWDVQTAKCSRVFTGHGERVTQVSFSQNDRFFFSSSGQLQTGKIPTGSLRLWDIQTGQCQEVYMTHGSIINSFGLTADGRFIVFEDQNGKLVVVENDWMYEGPD